MRRYHQVSGTLFALVALAQLVRSILGWSIQIDSVSIPVWASVVAFIVTGGMAIWAFRSARGTA